MAGDLEDFLRRAAQRRQQKAAQAQPQPQPKRVPPQYSDSRTERIVRPVNLDDQGPLDQPVLAAEIVDDDSSLYAQRMQKVEDARRAAASAKRVADDLARRSSQKTPSAGSLGPTGVPIQDLVNLLRQPGGIQQAILLREIFDRPEHRW